MAEELPAVDLITQIQDHLNDLCAMFFNFAGSLQRDAAAVAVGEEQVPDQPVGVPKHDIKAMATQIVQASKQLDELICQLPELSLTEGQQLDKISRVKSASESQGQELREAVQLAEGRLALVQDMFAALADEVLEFAGD
ncbi:hypothetical protein WJX73_005732 [Symbiochloris irregularis]|uniref:Mediator of RNA polymerase II transcription subunit 21 n=1 Tax=Symbiochloris irregularis TaxID=706552 RepID=A0AAW1PWH8_9CHLO